MRCVPFEVCVFPFEVQYVVDRAKQYCYADLEAVKADPFSAKLQWDNLLEKPCIVGMSSTGYDREGRGERGVV